MKPCIFVLALCAFVFSGCSQSANLNVNNSRSTTAPPAATATPDEFAFARANYATDCSNCHGREGKGGVVQIPDGPKLKVPSLCEGHALKHVDEDYVDQIENGGDGMPKFKGKLKPEEINALVRYVRHDFQGK